VDNHALLKPVQLAQIVIMTVLQFLETFFFGRIVCKKRIIYHSDNYHVVIVIFRVE
jgi:hypothetical protein